jgi:hypothetical protein
MRVRLTLCVVTVSTILATPVFAQDADALRKELEALRQQMERLAERLQKLEAAPAPTVASPPTPSIAPAPAAPPTTMTQAPSSSTPLSPQDVLRPRQPFSLYQTRGTGQLLFDMGIAGDVVANLTQTNVDKANGGTFAGRENRLFPREIELNLFGQIDPYARAEVRIEAGEEAPGAETGVSLAEAVVTLLALPYGTQAKFGQMRTRFGYQNVVHEHDLPWIDRPNVFVRFLGEEGMTEKGVEATWVPDVLPFYLEVLGGVFNGDNEVAFGRGKLRDPLVTGRIRTFFELGDENAIQLGLSTANGQTADRKQSHLTGFDLRYKLRPEGWLHPLLTVTGEALYSLRRVEVLGDPLGIGVPAGENRTRKRFGWYAGAEVQPFRRWAGGLRYDWTEYPVNPGREWSIEPYVTFWPSEFLRFRAAYKRTERTNRDAFSDNGGSARIADELLLQGTFILGAHPAHPF